MRDAVYLLVNYLQVPRAEQKLYEITVMTRETTMRASFTASQVYSNTQHVRDRVPMPSVSCHENAHSARMYSLYSSSSWRTHTLRLYLRNKIILISSVESSVERCARDAVESKQVALRNLRGERVRERERERERNKYKRGAA